MIQFNLLPDVKLAYIKAERAKHMVVSIAVLASIVSVAVFLLLLLVVRVVQTNSIDNINADIKNQTAQLNKETDLNKILTVQNQLSSLTALHDTKPEASRLFGYLGQVTPANVTISTVTTDFDQHTLTIAGSAPSLDAINTFVDTLKFTTYTTDKNSTSTKAFSNVVLSSFGRSSDGATYSIALSYDEPLFNVTNKPTLTVPKTITTRSITEQPGALFKQTETGSN